MTDVAYWEDQAGTVAGARFAVWAEDGWDDGVAAMSAVVDSEARPDRFANGVALDVGCGVGRLAIPFAERWRALSVVGVDPSPSMLAHAHDETERRWPPPLDRPTFSWLVNDGRTLPLADATVACGWSVLTFQHLPDAVVAGYLHEVARVLRADGRFVFQYVEGDGGVLHSHNRRASAVLDWCAAAGLRPEAVRFGMLRSQWTWVTVSA